MSTENGFDLLELYSALQKSIRRGLEYEAVHFAFELESFGKNSSGLWNRLKIIASEDIGCANPLMPILIETLHKHYLSETLEDSRQLFLVDAILCLCRSAHSRIVDDLLWVVRLERNNGDVMPIPDYALDMHTKRGKEKGRGYEHFFSEGSKVENEPFPNPYKEKHK